MVAATAGTVGIREGTLQAASRLTLTLQSKMKLVGRGGVRGARHAVDWGNGANEIKPYRTVGSLLPSHRSAPQAPTSQPLGCTPC